MTKKLTSEIRELNDSDLKTQIDDMRKELFDLRFQQATRQLSNTHQFKKTRLKLAQLLTVFNERKSSKTNSSSLN